MNMIVAVWLGHNKRREQKSAHDGIWTSKQGIVTPELSHSTIKVTSTLEVKLGTYMCIVKISVLTQKLWQLI